MCCYCRPIMSLVAIVGMICSFNSATIGQQPDNFQAVIRAGSVDLYAEYDLTGLSIPENQIHRLLPKDAIPALTDPKREKLAGNKWLMPESRLIAVESGDDVLGVSLQILDQHEIVNTTIGGIPVAITYCPLCDSATVFLRTVKDPDGKELTLEFGVSGALFNSNVLMYDRATRGLWSQLGMKAMSGPLAGTQLETMPVKLLAFREFATSYPDAEVVSRETGHRRDYSRSAYEKYFATDDLLVPVFNHGIELPRKTLGVGIAADDNAWFVPADSIEGTREIETPLGIVALSKNEAGIQVTSMPDGVRVAQSFYYSWSAFFPNTQVVKD